MRQLEGFVHRVFCPLWIVLLAATATLGQGCKRTEVTRGYLSAGPPAALRFAAPEAPVYDLPPLPKTRNPQPENVQPLPQPAPEPSAAAEQEKTAASRIIVNPAAPTESEATSGPVEVVLEPGAITGPTLLKFFPDGKPAAVEVLVNPAPFHPMPFVPPSSSAEYHLVPARP